MNVPAPRSFGAPAPRPARPQRCVALLPAAVARLFGFAALATFGALHWAQMVTPSASSQLLASVLAALVAAVVLIELGRAGRRTSRPTGTAVRAAATLALAAGLLFVAFGQAGVPAAMLDPREWGRLAAAIGQGVATVPTVRVPYSGLEEWTRIVLVLGGGVLVSAAALLAFAARREAGLGFPIAAAVVLGTLYAVPVMQRETDRPFLAGVAFALALALFLWLERVERRSALLAAVVVAGALLAGLATAPRLDGARALLDYEELAQSLSPATTRQYDWNHGYGALDWPRDGREVLRIVAPQRAYWKAVNLTGFDGLRWVQMRDDVDRLDTPIARDSWVHDIRVTVRALESSQFVTAGTALDISRSPRDTTKTAPGVFETAGPPLRRGHAYRARVYTPRPTAAALRAAGTRYPLHVGRGYGLVRLPARGRAGDTVAAVAFWRRRDRTEPGTHVSAADVLRRSAYARTYALARRLRADAATPYELMRAIERHLARGFRYTERPPRSTLALQDFLLRDRAGFCQQFSGAMALLLRLGGVPARVAAGFSPGVRDSERGEYVVRDIDAHSWVEVYFPGIGWVTRDPTPADSPARAQAADSVAGGADAPVRIGGSERALGGSTDVGAGGAPAADAGGDTGATLPLRSLAAPILVLALVALFAVRLRRRRRSAARDGDAQLAELRRALRRSGRAPQPPTTLDALARRFAGTPAEGYVRDLAAARYGFGTAPPTRTQRAALRRELGSGLGLRGRLRAWWALPPKAPRGRRFTV